MGRTLQTFPLHVPILIWPPSTPSAAPLWRVKLPSAALVNGMSLTRAGDVLVAWINGSVVCIGVPNPAGSGPRAGGDGPVRRGCRAKRKDSKVDAAKSAN